MPVADILENLRNALEQCDSANTHRREGLEAQISEWEALQQKLDAYELTKDLPDRLALAEAEATRLKDLMRGMQEEHSLALEEAREAKEALASFQRGVLSKLSESEEPEVAGPAQEVLRRILDRLEEERLDMERLRQAREQALERLRTADARTDEMRAAINRLEYSHNLLQWQKMSDHDKCVNDIQVRHAQLQADKDVQLQALSKRCVDLTQRNQALERDLATTRARTKRRDDEMKALKQDLSCVARELQLSSKLSEGLHARSADFRARAQQ